MGDTLVIGAGLAGSAAACLLAQAGRLVHLIDRETGPHHKVCGEFLSEEALAHLSQLGLEPEALGGEPIGRVRLVCGGMVAETALPFRAIGLSRHALDEALVARAAAAGARLERGVRVLRLDGGTAHTSCGAMTGDAVVLATGKLPVREREGAAAHRVHDGFVGFKMHYRLAPQASARLRGTILLALLDGGYAGLQMVEDGRANLCLVIRRSRLARLGGGWEDLPEWLDGARELAAMLRDAEPLFARPATIANLAYGMPPAPEEGDPLFRLGDRWAMTASLTGDGMAIALRSAFVAARCITAGEGSNAYRQRMAAQAGTQVARAMTVQNAMAFPGAGMVFCGVAALFPAGLRFAAQATRIRRWQ
ncbi:FAD-dependent monooxygenase [Novosphingobium sp. BL-8A]